MDSRIVVERVWLSEGGRRINYKYRGVGRAAKFFSGRPSFYAKYEVDLGEVPEGILFIPLVANLAPIAWLAGVPLEIPTLDAKFLDALGQVKAVFMRDYPAISDGDSPILVENPTDDVVQRRGGCVRHILPSSRRGLGPDLDSGRGHSHRRYVPMADSG